MSKSINSMIAICFILNVLGCTYAGRDQRNFCFGEFISLGFIKWETNKQELEKLGLTAQLDKDLKELGYIGINKGHLVVQQKYYNDIQKYIDDELTPEGEYFPGLVAALKANGVNSKKPDAYCNGQ